MLTRGKRKIGKHTVHTVTHSGMPYGAETRVIWEVDGKLFARINGMMRKVTTREDAGTKNGFRYEATI